MKNAGEKAIKAEYIILGVLLMASTGSSFAGALYVSAKGSDRADGSKGAPLRTLAKAASLAGPGDTVVIGEGIYRETLAPVRSGKPGAPITFRAAPGTKPVITGCDLLEDWKPDRGKKWRASVDWDLGTGCNQLFLNGKPMIEARYPNKTSAGIMEHDIEPLRFPKKGQVVGEAFKDATENQWAGACFFGHGYEAWAFQCARVESSSRDGRLVFDPQSLSDPWFEKPTAWGDPKRLAIGEGGGFLFGLPEFLDQPNEWYWEDDSVQIILPFGMEPASQVIEARRRARTLDLANKDHIVVRGLKFVAGSIRIKGNRNALGDCDGLYLAHFMFYEDGYAQDGGKENGIGVEVAGERNIIYRCRIAKTAAAGIGLSGRDNLVARCLIEDTDYAGTYGACITVSGEKHRICFNTLRRTGRDCLQIQGSRSSGGHRILFNDISMPGLICMDTGIIYFFGANGMAADGTQTRIAYNWVHDNPHRTPAPGIYLDNYVRNYLVDHNVVWNVPNDAGIRINAPSDNNRIANNTLFRTRPIGTLKYNAFPKFNPDPSFWTTGERYDLNLSNNLDLEDDPGARLINPAKCDFRLRPGDSSDLGAYPAGQPVWKPGHKGHADPALLSELNLKL